ncbi:hypothetical protein ACI3ET_12690 [Ornithinimicrobium sp. LYQ121]|uniref:hypothetical protein n=1 Tax=Ornithinimicrobium sp. LYQ121 TaxID=3378801 RepID=UPI003854D8F6
MTPSRPLAGLLAILPLAVLLLTVTVLPPPDRVPTHWAGRTPDGWTSGPAFLSAALTATVLGAIAAATVAVLRRAVPEAWSRWVVTTAATVGWGAVLLYAVSVWRTEVDGPDDVREVWALLAVAGALGVGALAYVVHGRRVPTLAQVRDRVPERSRVQALRGRAARPVDPWATEVSSTTMRVLGWGVLTLFAAMTVWVVVSGESLLLGVFVAVVGGTTAALALAWSAVRLHVDEDGLAVRSRVLPVRVARVRAEDVVGVETMDLDPMRWGGVGLRALPDRTAYIVDGGPGIVVWKRDGRRLALQVTEGEEVARAGARALLRAAGQRLGEVS